MSRSASDNSFRKFALPFGIFLIFGGAFLSVFAWTCPDWAMSLPPFEVEIVKRITLFSIAVLLIVLGAGFLKRRVWAIYGFIAYDLLGTGWHVAVGLADPSNRFLLSSPLINLPIGLGIYWCTRKAFFPSDSKERSLG